MNKALHQVGEYVMLMAKCISVPNRWSMFFKQLIKEIYKLGVEFALDCHYHFHFYRYGYRYPDFAEHQFSSYP